MQWSGSESWSENRECVIQLYSGYQNSFVDQTGSVASLQMHSIFPQTQEVSRTTNFQWSLTEDTSAGPASQACFTGHVIESLSHCQNSFCICANEKQYLFLCCVFPHPTGCWTKLLTSLKTNRIACKRLPSIWSAEATGGYSKGQHGANFLPSVFLFLFPLTRKAGPKF